LVYIAQLVFENTVQLCLNEGKMKAII